MHYLRHGRTIEGLRTALDPSLSAPTRPTKHSDWRSFEQRAADMISVREGKVKCCANCAFCIDLQVWSLDGLCQKSSSQIVETHSLTITEQRSNFYNPHHSFSSTGAKEVSETWRDYNIAGAKPTPYDNYCSGWIDHKERER